MELLKESESAAKKSINAVAIVLSIANVVDRCSEETSSRFSSGTEPKSRKWSTLRGQIIVPRVVVKLGQASWLVLTKKLCSQALRYARCSALAALRIFVIVRGSAGGVVIESAGDAPSSARVRSVSCLV